MPASALLGYTPSLVMLHPAAGAQPLLAPTRRIAFPVNVASMLHLRVCQTSTQTRQKESCTIWDLGTGHGASVS